MVKRRRQLQEAEKQLWALVVRDVAPLTGASLVPPAADTAFVVEGDVPPPTIPQKTIKKDTRGPNPWGGCCGQNVRWRPKLRLPLHSPCSVCPRLRKKLVSASPVWMIIVGVVSSKGTCGVEKRLDLHGMVAQEAFVRLMEFMDVAAHRGLRCVEIITGLGTGQEGGILRRELPHWLDRSEIRARILGLAYPHVGNKGSVRILLRKRR
ncbi:Smr/MutS family protein [Acetobacter okinawensis]|uniref:Smr/MutS family protein n=1 Tax=Acetobacter okinawensis TaxID=1076594 RepID=UPI000A7AB8A8|nr:Smr/MutS family protein [Acetobacter okinawensis]